jgi:metal-dependent hydrolase (beta-lactamase superfamily II)
MQAENAANHKGDNDNFRPLFMASHGLSFNVEIDGAPSWNVFRH